MLGFRHQRTAISRYTPTWAKWRWLHCKEWYLTDQIRWLTRSKHDSRKKKKAAAFFMFVRGGGMKKRMVEFSFFQLVILSKCRYLASSSKTTGLLWGEVTFLFRRYTLRTKAGFSWEQTNLRSMHNRRKGNSPPPPFVSPFLAKRDWPSPSGTNDVMCAENTDRPDLRQSCFRRRRTFRFH